MSFDQFAAWRTSSSRNLTILRPMWTLNGSCIVVVIHSFEAHVCEHLCWLIPDRTSLYDGVAHHTIRTVLQKECYYCTNTITFSEYKRKERLTWNVTANHKMAVLHGRTNFRFELTSSHHLTYISVTSEMNHEFRIVDSCASSWIVAHCSTNHGKLVVDLCKTNLLVPFISSKMATTIRGECIIGIPKW